MGLIDGPIDKTEQAGERLADHAIDHVEQATGAAVDRATAQLDEMVKEFSVAVKDFAASTPMAIDGVIDAVFQRLWRTRLTVDASNLRRVTLDISKRPDGSSTI